MTRAGILLLNERFSAQNYYNSDRRWRIFLCKMRLNLCEDGSHYQNLQKWLPFNIDLQQKLNTLMVFSHCQRAKPRTSTQDPMEISVSLQCEHLRTILHNPSFICLGIGLGLGLGQYKHTISLGKSSTWNMLSAILDRRHTKNHKHGCHNSTIQHGNYLHLKLNTAMFGSIFNLDMLLAILDASHYQKQQKWLPWFYHLIF